MQDLAVAAIGMQVGRQDAGLLAGFEQDGTSAIAEQHTGGTVIKIENAGEDFGADDQRLARRAAADHGVGHGQGIDETRAHRLHVKGRTTGNAQLVLHDAGRGGEHHVRRGSGDDDQVDLVCRCAGSLECLACGLDRQIAAESAFIGKMAGSDAGTLDNPFVGRLDTTRCQLLHQLLVGHETGRQIAAGTGDTGIQGHVLISEKSPSVPTVLTPLDGIMDHSSAARPATHQPGDCRTDYAAASCCGNCSVAARAMRCSTRDSSA